MTNFPEPLALGSPGQRGHYVFALRPKPYVVDRFATRQAARDFLANNFVTAQGSSFPFVREDRLKSGPNSVFDEVEFSIVRQHFRLYQSGQFVQVSGFWEDWKQPGGPWGKVAETPPAQRYLGVKLALGEISLFHRFAAKVASKLEAPHLSIGIAMRGLRDRQLVMDNIWGCLRGDPRAAEDEWTWEATVPLAEMVSQPDTLALDAFMDLLDFCNYRVAERQVWQGFQEKQLMT